MILKLKIKKVWVDKRIKKSLSKKIITKKMPQVYFVDKNKPVAKL